MRAEILEFSCFSRLFMNQTYRYSTPVGFADTPSSGGGIGCAAPSNTSTNRNLKMRRAIRESPLRVRKAIRHSGIPAFTWAAFYL
jgi:hypothetical protein